MVFWVHWRFSQALVASGGRGSKSVLPTGKKFPGGSRRDSYTNTQILKTSKIYAPSDFKRLCDWFYPEYLQIMWICITLQLNMLFRNCIISFVLAWFLLRQTVCYYFAPFALRLWLIRSAPWELVLRKIHPGGSFIVGISLHDHPSNCWRTL